MTKHNSSRLLTPLGLRGDAQNRFFRLGLIFLIFSLAAYSAKAIDIGPMTWTQRSDWLNVKTGLCINTGTVSLTGTIAYGDGVHDDTAAIQAALTFIHNHTKNILTVYFPPGTYNISQTLTFPGGVGFSLIGCGSNTIIKWVGGPGAAMFWPSLTDYMHYIGLTWNGNNVASCGYEHYANGGYETRIRHEYESFHNFIVTGTYMAGSTPPGAGIMGGWGLTADSMMYNCCFNNCTVGFGNAYDIYNNFEWVIDSCEFENCGTGINTYTGNDWVIANCHFLSSTNCDIIGLGARARHCTSYGSGMFAEVDGDSILQDCSVAAWTNTNCAVQFGWIATGAMFDCTFTNPPAGAARVLLLNGQTVALANNYAPNFPGGFSGLTNGVYSDQGLAQNIQPGLRYGTTGLLLSATQTFLHTGGFTDSTNIIDVVQQYGADPKDVIESGTAIQAAINAAQAANNGSVVYIPAGIYKVSTPLTASDRNYTIQGSGIGSELFWYGATSGTMLTITAPANLEVQQLVLAAQSGSTGGIVETSTGASNLVLDDVYCAMSGTGNPGAWWQLGYGPGVVLSNLPAGSTVYMPHLDSSLTVQNSSAAQIYGKFVLGGPFTVSGTGAKTGFLGVLAGEIGQQGNTTGWNVVVTDNQNLVLEDWYYEQAWNGIELESGSGTSPGCVAIQGFSAGSGINSGTSNYPTTQIMVNNYQGSLLYGWLPFINCTGTAPVQITQTGTNPFNMLLEGDDFYAGLPTITTSNSANLVMSQNQDEISGTSFYMSDYPNPLTGANLALLAKGLDPFRQLEAVDQSVQFGLASDGPPVAAYAFENDATDMTGNYNGTDYGATYQVGAVGMEAACFDGAGDYIQIPNPVTTSTNISISMWIQTTDTNGSGQWYNGHGLVDGETVAGAADFGTALVGGKFALGIGSPDTTLLTTGTVNDGKWHHLVGTYNSTSGAMQVFVDGTLNNSTTGPTGIRSAPTTLRFGGIQSGTSTGYYNGLLDQVQIYNYVLSGSEVAYMDQRTSEANPLVGYWKLNETSGTTSYDSSPSGENGTWINSPISSGSFPPAIASTSTSSLLFNGTNQYVNIPVTAALPNYGNPRTISVWAKTNTLTGNHVIADLGTTGGNYSFFIGQFGTSLEVGDWGSPNYITVSGFWDTNWHHIVATYGGDTVDVYADGMLVATGTGENWNYLTPPVSCVIGNYVSGTGYPWSGNIAEVRIYNRVLTPAEVAGMDTLVGFWDFDSQNAADSSGNGNNGTLVHNPTFSTNVPFTTSGNTYSISFSGSNYVQMPTSAPNANAINPNNEMTVAFWICSGTTGGTWEAVVSKDVLSGTNSGWEIQRVGTSTSLNLRIDTTGSNGAPNQTMCSLAGVFSGTWHFVAYVFNSGTVSAYLDGNSPVTSTYLPGSGFGNSSTPLTIGTSASPEWSMIGLVDEVQLYSRALTPAQILTLCKNPE